MVQPTYLNQLINYWFKDAKRQSGPNYCLCDSTDQIDPDIMQLRDDASL